MTSVPHANPQASRPAVASEGVVIKCAGVNKVFKDFWMRPRVKAVQDVNLEVRKGEVFGLLGPNGSGKSTTIKLILGLLHPTSGRIAVFGKRPEDVATKELIGYLPEESYLYRFLNARETLDYYGRLFHLPRHTRQKRIDMLLEMVGLEAAQHRPVGEYSKGMQRRIGLAQALINQPQLLILDEPTTGMDPIGTRQMKDLMVRLKERGITILLCSHLLADVEDVCDRVTIMFGGRVVEEGTIDELLVERDITSIEASQVDEETIQQIEQVLAKRGKHIERVSYRRQTLEKKFLDLVERERSKGSATSGAQSGGRIAGFLLDEQQRAGHMPEDADAAAVLDQLTKPVEPVVAAQVPAAEASAAREQVRSAEADAQILSQLSVGKGVGAVAAKPPTVYGNAPEPAPEADLSVLEGLVLPAAGAPVPKVVPPVKVEEAKSGVDVPAEPANRMESDDSKAEEALSDEMDDVDLDGGDENDGEDSDLSDERDDDGDDDGDDDNEPGQVVNDAKPQPAKAPPRVSKESGESGLGLMDGLSADDEDFDLPPIDPPKSTSPARPGKPTDERPDASFLRALEDVKPEDEPKQ